MALPSVLISALNGILAPFSEKYVLVLGAYYKLQTFIYLTANGIIQGIRPIVSFNYGAGETKRVRRTAQMTLALTAGVMAVGVALCQMMGIFTENAETAAVGATALRIISTGFVFSAVSVTCCGVLEALSRGIPSLIISIMRYAAVMIPTALLFSRFYGANGVFAAFPITEIITAAASFIIYKKCCPKQA